MEPDLFTRVALVSAAIMHAEGFWVPGARPRRNNNPGDLLQLYGVNIHYPTILDGAAALLRQVTLMLGGGSHVYKRTMTWREVAQLWTGGDNAAAWSASVCDDLQVDPDSTLAAYLGVTVEPGPSSPTEAPDAASQASPD